MVQKDKSALVAERTEILPAQEKIAFGVEFAPVLSAEQAFAQSFAVAPLNGGFQTQGMLP